MRLVSALVSGFGRLVDAKINLDTKLVAIIGPNEAGKTTLLTALGHVDTANPLQASRRSRAVEINDSDMVTTLNYVLDDDDLEALADLDLQQLPTRASIMRSADAKVLRVVVEPLPIKSVRPITQALDELELAIATPEWDEWIDPDTVYADPHSDAARSFEQEIDTLIAELKEIIRDPERTPNQDVLALGPTLLNVTTEYGVQLRSGLSQVNEWAGRSDPYAVARGRIWQRAPEMILFDEASRTLRSAYTLGPDLAESTPRALANLALTADLDIGRLVKYYQLGDIARRRGMIINANLKLDTVFTESWRQSSLSVHFDIDGDQLRIEVIEDGSKVSIFDERSAGLQMFIALSTFLRTRSVNESPILLIDEAETHLHIDAQADLVNMFVRQQQAVKIIYTTHSPACLPPDLGTGVRSVLPRQDGSQVSDISNAFWVGRAGFSPLMLALGAGAAAYTPVRYAALAEGASEMLLLPTLLRLATGEAILPYQVAPGLSEISRDLMPTLDLEAAAVAYVVDGDAGGEELRKSLISGGVNENLIVQMHLPGLENALTEAAYVRAVTSLVMESNVQNLSGKKLSIPTLPQAIDRSWSKFMANWAKEKKLRFPSKVAVASWLVENDAADLSADGESTMKELHERLKEVFKL